MSFANIKKRRFLRHCGRKIRPILTPVNPYVTGSSPVARATIYPRFLGFFIVFLYQKLRQFVLARTNHMPSKTIKNRYEIRPFLQKLHICIREHWGQNVFSSIFKGLNTIHFSSDTRNITQCVWQVQKTNTPFRVSHGFYIKNDIRTTIPCVTFLKKKTG